MNKFVNYGTRSISLPTGCKDLIDALRLGGPTPEPEPPKVGGFSDIETHLGRQLRAAAKFSNLTISWGRPFHRVYVHLLDGGLNVVAIAEPKSVIESAVRAFFERANLPLTMGASLKTLPAPTWFFRYLLPATAERAAAVIRCLLCEGFSVPEATRLNFSYVERETA